MLSEAQTIHHPAMSTLIQELQKKSVTVTQKQARILAKNERFVARQKRRKDLETADKRITTLKKDLNLTASKGKFELKVFDDISKLHPDAVKKVQSYLEKEGLKTRQSLLQDGCPESDVVELYAMW